MQINPESPLYRGAVTTIDLFGTKLPWLYTTVEDECLAARTAASLGVNLNVTPVFDVFGADAAEVLERTCTNRGFADMRVGQSKHALICNEFGHLIADGVVMRREDCYRTYWMAPVLTYYVMGAKAQGADVDGAMREDEYFFQIDGPKSLTILEEACECDLHDIAFARNKTVTCCGTQMVVHRLGMSGCLAYEVHGSTENFDLVYDHLRTIVEKHGGRPQGIASYGIVNHTPGGYPNQMQHYCYAYLESPDQNFVEFAKQWCAIMPVSGSAAEDESAFYVTPYEIGWGNLVSFKKGDYLGKEALAAAKEASHRVCVTLEWDAVDCAKVFSSKIDGSEQPYDQQMLFPSTLSDTETGGGAGFIRGDKVMLGDECVGIATGRCFSYWERRMISLAWVRPEVAAEGTELEVSWCSSLYPRELRVKATVARFPYFNGEWRNESCDVMAMVPERPYLKA